MIEKLSPESCRVAAEKMSKAIPRLIERGYIEFALNLTRRRDQLLARIAGCD